MTDEEFEAGDRILAALQAEREEWSRTNSRGLDRHRDGAQAVFIAAYRAHLRDLRAQLEAAREMLHRALWMAKDHDHFGIIKLIEPSYAWGEDPPRLEHELAKAMAALAAERQKREEAEAAVNECLKLADSLNEMSESGAGPAITAKARSAGVTWGSRVLQAVEPLRDVKAQAGRTLSHNRLLLESNTEYLARAEAAEKLLGAERKTIDELRAYLAYPQNEALRKLAAAEKRATEAEAERDKWREWSEREVSGVALENVALRSERDSLRARCEELEKAGGRLAAVVEHGLTGAPSAQALGLWSRALGSSRLSEDQEPRT